MRRAFAVLIVLTAAVAGAGPRAAAQQKTWTGEWVLPTKPDKDIKFSDWVGDRQVFFPFRGIMPFLVRDDRDGWLRIHDGHREGWADKADFVRVSEAPAYFHRRVEANPKDTYALYMRGTGWLRKGESDFAIKDFDECIRLNPSDTAAYNSRGIAWSQKQDYDRAIADYDEAIRLNPQYMLAFNNRGLAWQARKDYDRALHDFDEALRIDPNYVSAYLNRGLVWQAKKDYGRAMQDFDEAIRLDPKSATAYRMRGNLWRIRKENDRALRDLDEAIRLDPSYAFTWSLRGGVQARLKSYDKSTSDYSEAIRLSPKDAWSHLGRSVTLMLQRRPEAAGGFQAVIDVEQGRGKWTPYAMILGHFAARMAGDEARARAYLTDPAAKPDERWPQPILRYLRGEVDEPTLLRLAIDDDKRTEAHCYLGLDRVLRGRRPAAVAHFRWVKDFGTVTFIEYTIALAELERLEGPSQR